MMPQAVDLQKIADEASINKALLHYYFRSRVRLAEAVPRYLAVRRFQTGTFDRSAPVFLAENGVSG
jgi:AcrR family transcriptional regulator